MSLRWAGDAAGVEGVVGVMLNRLSIMAPVCVVYIYIYTCIYIYVHICVYIHIHVYIYTNMYIYVVVEGVVGVILNRFAIMAPVCVVYIFIYKHIYMYIYG